MIVRKFLLRFWWMAGPGYLFSFRRQRLQEECIPFSLVSAVDHETVIPEISQLGDMLICTSGQNYQWFLDGDPIPGANNNTWVAQESGTYTVEVEDDNMCMGLADPVTVTIVNNREMLTILEKIQVYPNPVDNELMIQFPAVGEGKKRFELEVFNPLGQLVMRKEKLVEKNYAFNVEGLEKGIYFVTISRGEESTLVKILKQ